MSEPAPAPGVSPLARALGHVPSGLYILTVQCQGRSTGMLASWVQQAGFAPPAVTVALASKRYVADWVAMAGRFTLNQLAVGSKTLMRHFARGLGPDAPAFEGVGLRDGLTRGGPVLDGAMAFLEAEVEGEVASADHRIFLGRIVAGGILDSAAEPFLHVRANGMHY